MLLLIVLLSLIELSLSIVPPLYGPYGKDNCAVEQIEIGGFVAGGSQSAYLLYPIEALKSNISLPFIAFGHGMTAGGNSSEEGTYSSYVKLLNSVCSYGYIIAAPESCPEKACPESFYKDIITTITTCKSKGTQLSPGLSIADFSKIGIYGHSMGSDATCTIATQAKQYNIVVGAPLHGGCLEDLESKKIEIPLLYFTGNKDDIVHPEWVLRSYQNDPLLPKVFAEIDGADHFEPTGLGRNQEDPYVAMWFDCFIKNNSTACNTYFFDSNSKDNICAGGPPMYSCS
eukprot:349742_1